VLTASGEIRVVVMGEGVPVLILGPAGDELKKLGTSCSTGVVDEVLEVQGEVRVIETTPRGDFQARLDLDLLVLERVAEFR